MLGSPILYLKGMRLMMFQLSGFYYRCQGRAVGLVGCDLDLGSWCFEPTFQGNTLSYCTLNL